MRRPGSPMQRIVGAGHPAACGSRQEIGFQRIAARPLDRHDFAARSAVLQICARAAAHAGDRGLTIRVVAIQQKDRGLVIADGPQPIAPGRRHMAASARSVAALVARVRQALPRAIPGMIVGRVDAARRETAFGDRRAALLRNAQQPRELDREILALGPPDPALRIDLKFHAMKVQNVTSSADFISHRSCRGQAQPTHGGLLPSRSKARGTFNEEPADAGAMPAMSADERMPPHDEEVSGRSDEIAILRRKICALMKGNIRDFAENAD